ncbi:Beta-galactosidase 6 [Linum grandiflorum]
MQINTCNGFYCDDFTPNSPSKPKMWTENYSGWFLSFGYPIPYRPVEDLAFSVARFFEYGGTFQNYYMVHFKGNEYFLAAWSVSILPDCKNVAFNTAKVQRAFVSSYRNEVSLATLSSWSWYQEQVGIWGNDSFTKSALLEQISTTKDKSDFLWYSTSWQAGQALTYTGGYMACGFCESTIDLGCSRND